MKNIFLIALIAMFFINCTKSTPADRFDPLLGVWKVEYSTPENAEYKTGNKWTITKHTITINNKTESYTLDQAAFTFITATHEYDFTDLGTPARYGSMNMKVYEKGKFIATVRLTKIN